VSLFSDGYRLIESLRIWFTPLDGIIYSWSCLAVLGVFVEFIAASGWIWTEFVYSSDLFFGYFMESRVYWNNICILRISMRTSSW
jgi:hypothetical protein